MSLDNIDDDFDKVAKKLANNSTEAKQTSQTEPTSSNETQTEKYEDKAKLNTSPLLSLFASHLKDKKTNTETDSEFRTIDLSEVNITPNTNPSPKEGANEVSEEEINKLLNITSSNNSTNAIKQKTSVQDIVYSQTRYSDLHTPPENVASFDDLSIKYTQNTNNASGPNISPSTEDAQSGFKPVNFSENYKKKKENDEIISSEIISSEINKTDTSTDKTDNVDTDILKKINLHRETKKNISERDGTLQEEEE
jgi:hypothetical protein